MEPPFFTSALSGSLRSPAARWKNGVGEKMGFRWRAVSFVFNIFELDSAENLNHQSDVLLKKTTIREQKHEPKLKACNSLVVVASQLIKYNSNAPKRNQNVLKSPKLLRRTKSMDFWDRIDVTLGSASALALNTVLPLPK